MKLLAVLLKVFFVAVVVGSAVGSEEGSEKLGTVEKVCPPEAGNQLLTIYKKIPVIMKPCYDPLFGDRTLWHNNDTSTEHIQEYCDGVCLRRATYRECLDEKEINLEECPDHSILKLFNIFRDIMWKTFNSGCAENAKHCVRFMKGLKLILHPSPTLDNLADCGLMTLMIVNSVEKSSADLSSKVFVINKEVNKLVECFKKAEFERPLKEVRDRFTNEVITTMQCIHPQDGTLVPCVSISDDLITAHSVCEIKSQNSALELHDILENDSGKCFEFVMKHDLREEDITADKTALDEDFKDFCYGRRGRHRCLNEQQFVAEVCLNGTDKNETKLWIDSINKGLEAACFEDGKRLADIMFEVYRLKRTGQGHAVWDCVDVAKSTRNVTDEHRSSSKNTRLYHEVEAFKECLVNKLHGDQTSVDAATSLIDDLLHRVECFGVEDGPAVLCESLMQDNHHNHHHHH